MTNLPFEYDESLILSCASSSLAEFVSGDSLRRRDFDPTDAGNDACQKLLEQHASHYGRPLDSDDLLIEYDGNNCRVSSRMRSFVSTVVLVHQHNGKFRQHKICLNQFADVQQQQLPLSREGHMDGFDSLWTENVDDSVRRLFDDMSTSFVRLKDKKSIIDAVEAMKLIPKEEIKRDHPYDINVIPAVPAGNYPSLRNADLDVSDYAKYTQDVKYDEDNDLTPIEDKFESNLNWASNENPDGVSIVHPAMDQGKCGSCWAFAATGTLEASTSRRAAFQTFRDVTKEQAMMNGAVGVNESALAFAQQSEQETLAIANLSVQELVDCDTAVDQGCTGGNPLLSFYFIHRFGLTSWANYPYSGVQGKCRIHRVAKPIATVQSWGILTPNHESNMELVLRYIGPIAVGINGADPTFLAYKGGIFDSVNCSQAANHALLIVGIGEETNEEDGSVVKYWIARNTWGVGWGEGGYIRVKRGDGEKGQAGVCGLAKNPSVAIGGTLLDNTDYETNTRVEKYVERSRSQQMQNSQLYSRCDDIDFSKSNQFRVECMIQYHRATMMGLASIVTVVLFVIWPLSSECRAQRRRMRRMNQRMEDPAVSTTEEASLLAAVGDLDAVSYGANEQASDATVL